MPFAPLLAAALAVASISYVPPVDAPVVDAFRPPTQQYGAGNRGIDFDTEPGQRVGTAADGVVVFSGRIGSATHVVVLHDDGLRTSYSFLDATTVRRGQHVSQGDTVGTARGTVHFGVRAGEEYLDPAALFGGGPPKVHLVPADHRDPLAVWEERQNLIEGLAGLGVDAWHATEGLLSPAMRLVESVGSDVAEVALREVSRRWTRLDEQLRAWAHVANEPLTHDERIERRLERVVEDQRDCTPSDTATPASPGAGRIAVLVGGLGSQSGEAAVLDVDTAALGYADGRVGQFSYAGGQSSGDRPIDGITVRDYESRDTWSDIEANGADLRALLQEIARAHPGVPVDLIAHSQGGIVVRAALTGADQWDPTLPAITNVITLASPHHGAVPATAANALALSDNDGVTGEIAGALGAPLGQSTQQLASSSHLIEDLGDRALPAGANVTSIAASGDLTVDAQMTAIDDATNVVVPIPIGADAHGELPGHAETHREIALALAGRGPMCRDLDLGLMDGVNLLNNVAWAADQGWAVAGRIGGAMGSPVHSSAAPGGNGPPG
jgi:hypothetical protein